jgi:hypothetical protein
MVNDPFCRLSLLEGKPPRDFTEEDKVIRKPDWLCRQDGREMLTGLLLTHLRSVFPAVFFFLPETAGMGDEAGDPGLPPFR